MLDYCSSILAMLRNSLVLHTLRGGAAVESVVSRLEDPLDPEFARSFVTRTSPARWGPEVLEQWVGDLLARVWRETCTGLLPLSITARCELRGVAAHAGVAR